MKRSSEQFLYNQHREDAQRVEKAKTIYNKNLEEAQKTGDAIENPELWDQASAEYQNETDKKIIEALKNKDYGTVEGLARGLHLHFENKILTEKNEEISKVNKIEKKILGIISETDMQKMKDWLKENVDKKTVSMTSFFPVGIEAIKIEINPKGDFNLIEGDLQKIEVRLEQARRTGDWYNLIYDMAEMGILTSFEKNENTSGMDI